jgi:hypothetical protein
MDPVLALKITFAISVAFSIVSTLHALLSPNKK